MGCGAVVDKISEMIDQDGVMQGNAACAGRGRQCPGDFVPLSPRSNSWKQAGAFAVPLPPSRRFFWGRVGKLHFAIMSMLSMLLMLGGVTLARAQSFPTISLNAGLHIVRAEVAADNETRMRGLMFRKSLEQNQGMLFVFDQPSVHCMWMKNTLIPLSVAFIAADGTIVNIADMKPHDETTHCAARAVPYALEMERGWFASRGLKAGTRITGLDKAPASR